VKVPERTLVVSPHSDDAVMSGYGILSKKVLPGPLDLFTAFSWTNYSVILQGSIPGPRTMLRLIPRPAELLRSISKRGGRLGSSPKGMAKKLLDLEEPSRIARVRLIEDLAFSKKIGASYHYSNLPDSKIRNGSGISDPSRPLETESEMLTELYRVLRRLKSKIGAQVIVAPWPYGPKQHIDHRLLHEVAIRIAEDTGVSLLYLDDLPYSRRPLVATPDRRGIPYFPVNVRLDLADMRKKFKAMRIYESQMIPRYFEAVREPPLGNSPQLYSETLWKPSRD